MIPSKCIAKTVMRECVVRSSGTEKKDMAVVLSATADGQMLSPMVNFKLETDQNIRVVSIPPSFIVKTPEKAWMNDNLRKVWADEIWFKHAHAECKKLGFDNSLLTFDAFAVHFNDGVKNQLFEESTDILAIPPGCTSKCQIMMLASKNVLEISCENARSIIFRMWLKVLLMKQITIGVLNYQYRHINIWLITLNGDWNILLKVVRWSKLL